MGMDTEKSTERADGNSRASEKACLRLALVEKVLEEGDLAVRWQGEVHLYHVSDVRISGTRGSFAVSQVAASSDGRIARREDWMKPCGRMRTCFGCREYEPHGNVCRIWGPLSKDRRPDNEGEREWSIQENRARS